jgi:hypothetical protein
MARKARTIPQRSSGQHIGYAVEANLRGILRRDVEGRRGMSVQRELPFEFHVRPDAVVVEDGKIRALFIVAYNTVAANSNMKFYRTRSEYRAIVSAAQKLPAHFHPRFVCCVVLYGTASGWKAEILEDLAADCDPLLFLPRVIGEKMADKQVTSVFNEYRDRFEQGRSDAADTVEELSRCHTFCMDETIGKRLHALLFSRAAVRQSRKTTKTISSSVRVPELFCSRYRQGLGLASLFTDRQLEFLADGRCYKSPTEDEMEALRRLRLLDVGTVRLVTGISGPRGICIDLRKRLETRGGSVEQVAYRPDFSDWTKLDPLKRTALLQAHRSIPVAHPRVFRSGANEQAASNVAGYLRLWANETPQVVACLRSPTRQSLVDLAVLIADTSMSPASWHPCSGIGTAAPLWELLASALRCSVPSESDQEVSMITLPVRRPKRVSPRDVSEWLRQSITHAVPALAADLIEEVGGFSRDLLGGGLPAIAGAPQPRLLSLSSRESWSNALYRAIATNKTHNPLLATLVDWLSSGDHAEWTRLGWPSVRSVGLNRLPGVSAKGRIQWQCIAYQGRECILAEARTITANNWGNKSKEMYDRIAASRRLLESCGWKSRAICVLDGDFEAESAAELRTGIGFDETYSFAELVQAVSARKSRLSKATQ